MPDKIPAALTIDTRKMDRTLALDVADHLRYGILGRDRYEHVDMIRHQVPLLYPTLLVRGQLPKHFTQMLTQLSVQRLAPALWNEDHVVFALPLTVA
jgi:hypothetical protein